MATSLPFSLLELASVREGDSIGQTLANSVAYARHAESLGFNRFWLAEHHNMPGIASAATSVLIGHVAGGTSTIRVGSGGIMLPHYSAYKVAEVFSLLANLYPGRIDLGIGRAPGADMTTAVALATDGRPKFERFPELVEQLRRYLQDDDAKPVVSPKPPNDLPLWVLGSSADSAQLAAERGLPYNLALFINPQAQQELVRLYKQYFKSSKAGERPYGAVTIGVFCCDTQEQAEEQQHTYDINFFRRLSGQFGDPNDVSLLTPAQAKDFAMTPQLEGFIAQRRQNRAVGTPEQVCSTIRDVAKCFAADEVMMVTNMFDFEDRKRSFELVKNAF